MHCRNMNRLRDCYLLYVGLIFHVANISTVLGKNIDADGSCITTV